MDSGLIKDESDLYELTRTDLLRLDNIKEKSAANLLGAIEKSKAPSLGRFIYALGIRHVGEFTAALLSERFGNIDALSKADRKPCPPSTASGRKSPKACLIILRTRRTGPFLKGCSTPA